MEWAFIIGVALVGMGLLSWQVASNLKEGRCAGCPYTKRGLRREGKK